LGLVLLELLTVLVLFAVLLLLALPAAARLGVVAVAECVVVEDARRRGGPAERLHRVVQVVARRSAAGGLVWLGGERRLPPRPEPVHVRVMHEEHGIVGRVHRFHGAADPLVAPAA